MQKKNHQNHKNIIKIKPLNPKFISKLKNLIKNYSTLFQWSKPPRSFIINNIKQQSLLSQSLQKVFKMSFSAFNRYLKLIRFKKINQLSSTKYYHPLLFKTLKNINTIKKNKKIKKNIKSVNNFKGQNDQFPNQQEAQCHMNIKSNLQEISLEMKLRSQQEMIQNVRKIKNGLIEAERQKKYIMQEFKRKYDRCDSLIDNVIYSMLMGHKNKKIDEEQILNQISQLQDLFSENQRDIQRCVSFLEKQRQMQQKGNIDQNIMSMSVNLNNIKNETNNNSSKIKLNQNGMLEQSQNCQ